MGIVGRIFRRSRPTSEASIASGVSHSTSFTTSTTSTINALASTSTGHVPGQEHAGPEENVSKQNLPVITDESEGPEEHSTSLPDIAPAVEKPRTSLNTSLPAISSGAATRGLRVNETQGESSADSSARQTGGLPTLTPIEAVQTLVLPISPHSFNFVDDSDASRTGVKKPLPFEATWITTATSKTYMEDLQTLKKASALLGAGHPIAVPTETVYGLAANALNPAALEQIYKIKGRPSDNPLIVHVNALSMLDAHVAPFHAGLPLFDRYKPLIDRFWPGPLTILLPKHASLPSAVTRSHLVAVRMPSHPIMRALINLTGFPLAAPSANLSGRPSPTTANHVLQDLERRVRCILDDGDACQNGLESTVIDGTCDPPMLLRHGSISLAAIRKIPGWSSTVSIHALKKERGDQDVSKKNNEEGDRPRTPGMKYRHYAPRGQLTLLAQSDEAHICDELNALLSSATLPLSVGLLWYVPNSEDHGLPLQSTWAVGNHVNRLAAPEQEVVAQHQLHVYKVTGGPDAYAHALFHALRWFDDQQCDDIFACPCASDGVGDAVMERLRKAACGT